MNVIPLFKPYFEKPAFQLRQEHLEKLGKMKERLESQVVDIVERKECQ